MTDRTTPAQIEALVALAMSQAIAGTITAGTLEAVTRAAAVYVELQELSDLEARIAEIEAWKTTFRFIQPAALSA